MKVQSVVIDQVMGLEHLEIKPGAVTIISGRNGSGKTSLLEALRGTLSGGHDPSIIRKGAEAAEISITLADGIELRKRVTPEKSTLTVRHPQFGKISKSQAWINQIVDSISLDPIAFLTAPAKERVNILLEALPMTVTADQLGFVPAFILQGKDLDSHALDVLGSIQRDLYDQRTEVNRAAREKKATVTQMSSTLPAEPPEGDWDDEVAKTTAVLRELNRSTQAAIGAVKDGAAAKLDALERDADARAGVIRDACLRTKQGLRDELDVAIEKLRADTAIAAQRAEAERDAQYAVIAGEREAKMIEVEHSRNAELERIENDYVPRRSALTEDLGKAKAMADQHARATQTREMIAKFEGEAATYEGQSEQLSTAMKQLEALKASLLEKLPVPGLEVKDGALFVDGVAFERVNQSMKVRIAIEVAKLKSRDLGLIVIDNGEQFDSKGLELFKREAKKSGLQFVLARVADTDLTVEAEGVAVQ